MTDEAAFIAAIQDNPDDDSFRMVYADRLEARADPRAEYLRLVAEMTPRSSPSGREDPLFVRLYEFTREGSYAQLQARSYRPIVHIDRSWREAVGKRFDLVLVAYPAEHKTKLLEVLPTYRANGPEDCTELIEGKLPAVVVRSLLREEAEFRGDNLAHLRPPYPVLQNRPESIEALFYKPPRHVPKHLHTRPESIEALFRGPVVKEVTTESTTHVPAVRGPAVKKDTIGMTLHVPAPRCTININPSRRGG